MKVYRLSLLALFIISVILSCKKKEDEVVKEKVKLYITADTGIYLTAFPLVLQLSGTNIETQNNIKSAHVMQVEYNKGEVQTLNLKVVSGKIETAMTLEVATSLYQSEKNRVAYKVSTSGDISLTFTP